MYNYIMNFIKKCLLCINLKIKSRKVVSVINLYGILGKVGIKNGLNITDLNDSIEKAFNVKHLVAVCLNINSPGGSPVQSELIAKRIISLSITKNIPVYSFVEDVAASGGYWLACAGSEIYASKNSIIGSIGVISAGFGFHKAINKLGIERRIYTEGKNKSILDPFKPVDLNDVEIIQNLQKQIHTNSIDYIKERRMSKLMQTDDVLFNGSFWDGNTASNLGLIDGINDINSFITEKFGFDTKIKYICGKQSWLKKKLGVSTNQQEMFDSLLNSLDYYLFYNRFNIL